MKLLIDVVNNESRKFHTKTYDTRHLFKNIRLSLICNEIGGFSKSETLGIYTCITPLGMSIIP